MWFKLWYNLSYNYKLLFILFVKKILNVVLFLYFVDNSVLLLYLYVYFDEGNWLFVILKLGDK